MANTSGTAERQHGAALVSRRVLRALFDGLDLPVFLFEGVHSVDQNGAARALRQRLRQRFRVEIEVMLVDQLSRHASEFDAARQVLLCQRDRTTPLQLTFIPLGRGWIAVSVRELRQSVDELKHRYRLSTRESEVADLVLSGHRNKDVARKLGISEDTTKKHLSHIFAKIGVASRTQLLRHLGAAGSETET